MTAADDAPRRERRPRPELPAHRRLRRRLLAWSAPVVLAVLVVGSLLLGTALGNLLGTREYDALRFPEAARQYEAQQRWTGFAEQWKAWFNSGTALYRAEEHFLAAEDLRVALELVPEAGPLPDGPEGSKAPESPECRVRTNLSLAIEAMGDVASTADDDPGMAEAYYVEAQEVIAPCTSAQQNEETSERQQDKEEEARRDQQDPDEQPTDPPTDPDDDPTEQPTDEPTGEPDGDATDDPTGEPEDDPTDEPTDEPTDDPQREELEQRNRDAERDRQEQQERGGGGFGGGQNW